MAVTFTTTLNPTPFGIFDSDAAFQADAERIIPYVLRSLGEDVLSVELSKKMIWSCFEEATLAFNANIIEYQAKSSLVNLLGTPTGSTDPITGHSSINLTNVYVRPNFEFLIRQAEPYAAEVGYGQSLDSYSGSIQLNVGQQDYDLYTDLVDHNGVPLSTYMASGSSGRMKVFEVFHQAPVQFLFNSNLASNFVATGLPVESYIPDTRFYVLPLFEDVLRSQNLKTAARIRRSNYTYRITGRKIRIFPAPNENLGIFSRKLWIRVGFPSSAAPGIDGMYTSGSYSVSGSSGLYPAISDGTLYGASNPANIPMGAIEYASLNLWAKNWIYKYTLALCTVLLGRVRNKFKSIPIPGAELTLNGDDLISQGREDLDKLLNGEGGLVGKLESLTYDKLAEKEANMAEQLNKQLKFLPLPPGSNLSRG